MFKNRPLVGFGKLGNAIYLCFECKLLIDYLKIRFSVIYCVIFKETAGKMCYFLSSSAQSDSDSKNYDIDLLMISSEHLNQFSNKELIDNNYRFSVTPADVTGDEIEVQI